MAFLFSLWYNRHVFGVLAQLGERSAGSRKVKGSSPLYSTKLKTSGIFVSDVFSYNIFYLLYNVIIPDRKGVIPYGGGILMILLSSFVLPLLADILFEIWKEKRSKDKKQD